MQSTTPTVGHKWILTSFFLVFYLLLFSWIWFSLLKRSGNYSISNFRLGEKNCSWMRRLKIILFSLLTAAIATFPLWRVFRVKIGNQLSFEQLNQCIVKHKIQIRHSLICNFEWPWNQFGYWNRFDILPKKICKFWLNKIRLMKP